MSAEPLLELKSLFIATGFPARLTVYDDGVEVVTVQAGIRPKNFQRVRYEQIAQVFVHRGWVFATLIIETRGGAALKVTGLMPGRAMEAKELIDQRM
jgi:hypothetical protein